MALHAVHHVAILVSDYQASRHFYVDLLGFRVVRENWRPQRQDWKLDLAVGNLELEIFSAPNAPERPTHPEALGLRHLAFRVENVEQAAEGVELLLTGVGHWLKFVVHYSSGLGKAPCPTRHRREHL